MAFAQERQGKTTGGLKQAGELRKEAGNKVNPPQIKRLFGNENGTRKIAENLLSDLEDKSRIVGK